MGEWCSAFNRMKAKKKENLFSFQSVFQISFFLFFRFAFSFSLLDFGIDRICRSTKQSVLNGYGVWLHRRGTALKCHILMVPTADIPSRTSLQVLNGSGPLLWIISSFFFCFSKLKSVWTIAMVWPSVFDHEKRARPPCFLLRSQTQKLESKSNQTLNVTPPAPSPIDLSASIGHRNSVLSKMVLTLQL